MSGRGFRRGRIDLKSISVVDFMTYLLDTETYQCIVEITSSNNIQRAAAFFTTGPALKHMPKPGSYPTLTHKTSYTVHKKLNFATERRLGGKGIFTSNSPNSGDKSKGSTKKDS
tara:strand:+ start:3343 stop:3684 length:342 start_codon:yes stop_codon:yes gene_type:complete